MRQQVLLDTGPLVASLDRQDNFHSWSAQAFQTVHYPLITCESVITEACFLLSNTYGAQEAVMSLIEKKAVVIDFSISNHADALSRLMDQYSSVPMSLADACLLRMAELKKGSAIMTFDSDFTIYRMHRNQPIPLLMPDGQRNYS